MINEIVELIIKEAKTRPVSDPVSALYSVKVEVDLELGRIMNGIREEERVNEESEITKDC